MAGSRSGAGKMQDELEIAYSDRRKGSFLRLIDLYQNDIKSGLKGLPMAKIGTIGASKRIMIIDIDKMCLIYKIHDFIKAFKKEKARKA